MVYIVLEGIDGSGKTFVANKLLQELVDQKMPAIGWSEPFNPEIRALIESIAGSENKYKEEALANLFAADRMLIKEMIEQHNNENIIISDRSKYSSFAYQNIDLGWNKLLNHKMPNPDVVIYLDIDVDVSKKRTEWKDSFEEEVTLERARSRYIDIIKKSSIIDGVKFIEINGNQPKDIVYQNVFDVVMEILGVERYGKT